MISKGFCLKAVLLVVSIAFLCGGAFGQDLTITSDTSWTEGDYSFASLTVTNGATLAIAGRSVISVSGNVTVAGGSKILLQGKNTSAQVNGQWAGVGVTLNTGSMNVDGTSQISADAQGYVTTGYYGLGPGGAVAGASYGGRGSGGAPVYGSTFAPVDLGSAGGGDYGEASAGGGAIRLNVTGTLVLDGRITANGQCLGYHANQGSGGSIYATVGMLAGSGRFEANGGGLVCGYSGKGGGGRVAVYYENAAVFSGFTASTAAAGGAGASNGTILFVDTTVPDGHVKVYHDLAILQDETITVGEVTLDDAAILTLEGGSTLTVRGALAVTNGSQVIGQGKNNGGPVNGAWAGAGVTINAGSLSIDAGSKISADGQGYYCNWESGGNGPGGGGAGSGGSYGGKGTGSSGPTYGSAAFPVDLGSAGPAYFGQVSRGGGSLRLNVDGALNLDGEITADGTCSATWNCSGGSGGSLFISAGTLAGAGQISANGAYSQQGKGGGGRIAIYYRDSVAMSQGNMSVAGGGGGAGDGTLVIEKKSLVWWTEPVRPLFHGTKRIAWDGVGIAFSSIVVDLFVSNQEGALRIGEGLPFTGSLDWNSLAVSDGVYELRAIFRDEFYKVVRELTRDILVNNSAVWHSGRIAGNEVWSPGTVHIVEGDVIIPSGVTLTIEPGTIVKFAEGTKIVVESGGILNAAGTSDNPVIFTSLADDASGGDTNLDSGNTRPVPGYWGGVVVQGSGQFNSSRFTELRYSLMPKSGTLATSETWPGTHVYPIAGTLVIPAGVKLIVGAGAVVKFDAFGGIEVQSGGELVAQGSVAEPIYFTSIKDDDIGGDTNHDGDGTFPAAGDWRWIDVNGGQATLNHVHVSFGGGTSSGSWDRTGMIRTSESASLTLSNSVLQDSFFDGLLNLGGQINVTNSVVVRTDRAVCANGGTIDIINSTLDDNRIGLLIHGGTMNAANTIVANSLETGVLHDYGPDALAIRYSNVWGSGMSNYGGTADRTGTDGNISADPRFKDRARGNYRLDYVSPCIDAADGAFSPETDFMGAPRYDDPRTPNTGVKMPGSGAYPDMGAFEFVETAESDLDLIVSWVSGPSELNVGEEVQVEWEITNIGTAEASGSWHDRISLVGTNAAGEPLEIFVGEVLFSATLGPGASASFQALVRVPAGTADPYFWSVSTNYRGEIFEGKNFENNTGMGLTVAYFSASELRPGQPFSGDFAPGKSGDYFWVYMYEGEQLRLCLDTADDALWTEIYLRLGALPTRTQYDFRSLPGERADHCITIPAGESGIYYVWISTPVAPAASVSYLLTLSRSTVTDLVQVTPAAIGKTGKATLKIEGNAIGDNPRAFLVKAETEIEAVSVFYQDSTTIYATFDAEALPSGTYDVRVTYEKLNVSETGDVSIDEVVSALAGAVTVSEKEPGRLFLQLQVPERVRAGRPFDFYLTYTNTGSTDLRAPVIVIEARGAKLRIPPEEDLGEDEVQILGISTSGPADILRPGQTETLRINATASSTVSSIDIKAWAAGPGFPGPSPESLLDAVGIDPASPLGIEIASRIPPLIGTTWDSYEQALADVALKSSLVGFTTIPLVFC